MTNISSPSPDSARDASVKIEDLPEDHEVSKRDFSEFESGEDFGPDVHDGDLVPEKWIGALVVLAAVAGVALAVFGHA
jgi:hypothetical protein